MFEKVFNLEKKYWIYIHCIILAIGVAWAMYLFGQTEVVTYDGPKLVYQSYSMLGLLFYTVVAIVAGVFFFPSFIINSVYYVTNMAGYSLFDDYYALTLFIIPFLLFVVYYGLWLIPDTRWNEERVKYIRISRVLWFVLALISALFFSNMF